MSLEPAYPIPCIPINGSLPPAYGRNSENSELLPSYGNLPWATVLNSSGAGFVVTCEVSASSGGSSLASFDALDSDENSFTIFA